MTARQISHTEGASTHYRVEGTTRADVDERIAAIRRTAHELPCSAVFTVPHKMPNGLYRAAGWVDPL